MADVTQTVETQLKVIDQATGPLGKIAQQADKASGALHNAEKQGESFAQKLFNGMRDVAGIAGVVGGALSLKAAWESSDKYIKSLKEVHELTGATVEQTDFLFSSARKAGVEYNTMQRVMFNLSRRGSMLEQSMAAANGQHTPGLAKKFQRMGVVMDKGPVKALETMSQAMKAGKLDTADLMSQFRIPPDAVNDFKGFLEDVDASTLAKLAKGEKVEGLVGGSEVDAFNKMESAQHRMSDAFNRIKVLVLTKLYPVFADMAERFADKIEEVIPKAAAFGKYLAERMDYIVGAAKTFVAVMTAKKMMDLAKSLTSPGGLLTKATSALQAAGAAGGGPMAMIRNLMGGAAGGGAGMGGVMAGIQSFGAALAPLGPVILAVAAAVALAWLGFRAFEKNIGGVGDRISLVWDTIKARFELMWETIDAFGKSVFGLFGGDGGLLDLIGYIAALSFEGVLYVLDGAVHTLQTVMSMGGELVDMIKYIWKDVLADGWREYVVDPFMKSMKWLAQGVGKVVDFFVDQYNTLVSKFGGSPMAKGGGLDLGWLEAPLAMFKKHWELTNVATTKRVEADRAARKDLGRETPSARPPSVNYDFRGSRFDITQNFAEGFDPDRIAVAFSNDLAALGEMRTQSGLAPAFALR